MNAAVAIGILAFRDTSASMHMSLLLTVLNKAPSLRATQSNNPEYVVTIFSNQQIHVAVGVIKTDDNHVLISKRHAHLHQGGLWEFPGGKVAAGETVQQALARELHEELGIGVVTSRPLIKIPYDYGDKHVLLDVYVVTAFTGDPHGKEDQIVKIVPIAELQNYEFPAANRGIVSALQLPQHYMITRECAELDTLLLDIDKAIANGVRLIQFRDHTLDFQEYLRRLNEIKNTCLQHQVILLANTSPENFAQCDVAGLHLASRQLLACKQRPIERTKWLGASVHNEQQLRHALAIEVDYVLVSPVKYTASHPEALAIGWEKFAYLTRLSSVPVYALGGMTHDDLVTSTEYGGQGIAGIRLFA